MSSHVSSVFRWLWIGGCGVFLGAAELLAQFEPPSPERFATFFDRDGNGVLDNAELDAMPGRLRDSLEDGGVDLSRPAPLDRVTEVLRNRFEARRAEMERAARENDDVRGAPEATSDSYRGGDGVSFSSGDAARFAPAPSTFASASAIPSPPSGNRIRITSSLPDSHAAADTDFDGQIGLYEWRAWKGRASVVEFRSYDRNNDGFVTPRELQLGPTAVVTVASLPAASPVPSSSSSMATASPVASTSSPSSDSHNQEQAELARKYFGMLDKDRSGKISGEEWGISRRIRGAFEQQKIDLANMNETDFVSNYVRILGSAGR